jgi:hypothetical protein
MTLRTRTRPYLFNRLFTSQSLLIQVSQATPPNFALELTRGPFRWHRRINCTAARRLHFAPSEALV